MKLNYSGKASIYTLPKQMDVLSTDEFRTMIQDQYADNPNALGLLGDSDTNWQDAVLGTSFGQARSQVPQSRQLRERLEKEWD